MQPCADVHASLDCHVWRDRACKTPSLTGTGRGDHAKHGGWGCGPMSEHVARISHFFVSGYWASYSAKPHISPHASNNGKQRGDLDTGPSELDHCVRYDSILG